MNNETNPTRGAVAAAEEIELKPCPFCGSEAEIKRRGTARQSMQIGCTNCHCEIESGDVCGLTKPDNYSWNTRHDEKTGVAELVWCLGQIINDLPTKRDWLCPDVEKAARAVLAKYKPE